MSDLDPRKPAAELPEHVRRHRAAWDVWAQKYAEPGERNCEQSEPTWGIWDVAEADVGMLPHDLTGKDAIELGCGTAYVSAWMARRGAARSPPNSGISFCG
ncbi:MAG: hypothetical protein FJ144_23255 [Deltaproteobacteria bacterium]|nr:hypothetical protein [Deltaproteobacteria bacterium]